MSINNSNGSRIEVNGHPHIIQEATEPTPQFRGTFNHAQAHHLLYDGKITTTVFALLAVIDSFVNARGEGCWASNRYLGKLIGKSIGMVKYGVDTLKKLGIVEQVGTKWVGNECRRVLITKWSMRDPVNLLTTPRSTSEPPPGQEVDHHNKYSSNKDKKNGDGVPPAPPATLGLRPKSNISLYVQDTLQRFKEVIEKRGKIDWKPKIKAKWIDSIRRLEKRLGQEEIEDILQFYEKNPLHRYKINSPTQLLNRNILRIVREILQKVEDNPETRTKARPRIHKSQLKNNKEGYLNLPDGYIYEGKGWYIDNTMPGGAK